MGDSCGVVLLFDDVVPVMRSVITVLSHRSVLRLSVRVMIDMRGRVVHRRLDRVMTEKSVIDNGLFVEPCMMLHHVSIMRAWSHVVVNLMTMEQFAICYLLQSV